MDLSFEKQPAYDQAMTLIRTIDDKLQYTKKRRDKRIPEMERFLNTLQDAAASIARTGAHQDNAQRAAHARLALEHTLAAFPDLVRLLQMDVISSREFDDFHVELSDLARELDRFISSCGA